MQPYGLDLQSDKGLFTFYREQEEAQSGLKNKISADHLQKMLGKVIRMNLEQKKKQIHRKTNDKALMTQRQTQNLKQTSPIESTSATKRQQLKLKKSIIEQPQQINLNFQLEGKYIQNLSKTANTSVQHQSLSIQEEPTNNESFSKYMSELDKIKLKKKAIYKQSISTRNDKQNKKSQSPVHKKTKHEEEKIIQISKSKLILHFKKMALEPQEFNGLADGNKNFAPLSRHKRVKSGLKSYRKQKQKLEQQKKVSDFQQKTKIDKPKEQYSIFDKQAMKSLPLATEKPNDQNIKLIRVQRFFKEAVASNQPDKKLIEESKSTEIPQKLKFNLPQLSNRYRQHSNGTSMSLELMKSNKLKNKYQIRQLEKQSENMININEKVRNQLKQIKNSPKQINHYISLNNSPSKQAIQSQRQLISMHKAQKPVNNSIELLQSNELSFKKQKQIFCKRDQYFRGYSKRVKRNKFSLEKQDQIKIRSFMEDKKRQIIENLMEKLSFI